MGERLSRWGVGPRIMAPLFATAAVTGGLSWRFPDACLVEAFHAPAARAAAVVLIAIGLAIWLSGAVFVMRAYNRDQLVTSGIYALVRHPIYSGWIVFIAPGVALLTRAWPLIAAPLVGYALFKSLIGREDEYLAKRFGRAYLEYRARVRELVPIPRFRRP